MGVFREKLAPGVFKRSLAGDIDVRSFFNHNPDHVLGRQSAKTLEVSESDDGLSFRAEMPATSWADDLMVSIGRRDVSGVSFQFQVVEGGDEWKEKDGETTRIVRDADLFEIGPVTFPAYPDSDVSLRALLPGVDISRLSGILIRRHANLEVSDDDLRLLNEYIEALTSILPEKREQALHSSDSARWLEGQVAESAGRRILNWDARVSRLGGGA